MRFKMKLWGFIHIVQYAYWWEPVHVRNEVNESWVAEVNELSTVAYFIIGLLRLWKDKIILLFLLHTSHTNVISHIIIHNPLFTPSISLSLSLSLSPFRSLSFSAPAISQFSLSFIPPYLSYTNSPSLFPYSHLLFSITLLLFLSLIVSPSRSLLFPL